MLETIKEYIAAGGTTLQVSAIGVCIAYVLKQIPNDDIKKAVDGAMYNFGVFVTLGLAKWRWTGGIWNKTIEPYLVDAVDNIVVQGIASFIKGLRSDNT